MIWRFIWAAVFGTLANRLDEWLVRTIEKEFLHKHFAKPRLKETTKIAIDELSIGGGHRYLTIVMDLQSGAILHVGDGKGAGALSRPQPAAGHRLRP